MTSLNRQHKRVDYLIEEVARLDGDPLLWLDGSLQPDGDATLLELASQRLGNRYRLTHAPSDRLGELFRLADVMVSTSLHESYGMSVVESMCAGLPVLTHDSEHFRWLVGDAGHRVDMQTSGNLSARLAYLMRHPSELCGPVDAEAACRRFRWAGLKTAYLDMYRKVIGAGPEHPGRNATTTVPCETVRKQDAACGRAVSVPRTTTAVATPGETPGSHGDRSPGPTDRG